MIFVSNNNFNIAKAVYSLRLMIYTLRVMIYA